MHGTDNGGQGTPLVEVVIFLGGGSNSYCWNKIFIAGGGGGGAGRPHGAGQINGSGNGGGRVASSATGEGNDGSKNNPTHNIGSDSGGQGGQKNGGGIAGTADYIKQQCKQVQHY